MVILLDKFEVNSLNYRWRSMIQFYLSTIILILGQILSELEFIMPTTKQKATKATKKVYKYPVLRGKMDDKLRQWMLDVYSELVSIKAKTGKLIVDNPKTQLFDQTSITGYVEYSNGVKVSLNSFCPTRFTDKTTGYDGKIALHEKGKNLVNDENTGYIQLFSRCEFNSLNKEVYHLISYFIFIQFNGITKYFTTSLAGKMVKMFCDMTKVYPTYAKMQVKDKDESGMLEWHKSDLIGMINLQANTYDVAMSKAEFKSKKSTTTKQHTSTTKRLI